MNKWFACVLLVLVVLLAACQPAPDVADSDNPSAAAGATYYDPHVYILTVRVGGDPESHTEIHGAGSAFSYGGTGYGSVSIWQDGKGLLRAQVVSISPTTPLVAAGDTVILKTEDLKMAVLVEGDTVEIKCRFDHEPIKSITLNDIDEPAITQTWELDYCRMITPVYEEAQP